MKKGFTLIELVIVVSIIAIIGAIAVPWIKGSKQKRHHEYTDKQVDLVEATPTPATPPPTASAVP